MKEKVITGLIVMYMLFGIVAAGTITDVSLLTPQNMEMIAGGSALSSFEFEYPDLPDNYNNAPLVIRANITSLNENYPVWKNDFQISMIAEQYLLFGSFYYNTIPMTCKEYAPISFKAKDKPDIQYSIKEIKNGTFYCYNPNYYMLQLDSYDKIFLNLKSSPLIYPGNYSLTLELMEMEPDYEPPRIELKLDNIIFNENQNIPIKLNVSDDYEIKRVEYKISNPDINSYYNSGWIEVQLNSSSGFYEDEFNFTEYELNSSGEYWIFARACDVLGNCREM